VPVQQGFEQPGDLLAALAALEAHDRLASVVVDRPDPLGCVDEII
jgi:hypothetical protein